MNYSRNDRIYTVLVGVLAAWTLAAACFTTGLATQAVGYDRLIILVDTAIGLAFVCLEAAVLYFRIWLPERRRQITFVLNIALTLFFPIGTALAIYGFWKIDKRI